MLNISDISESYADDFRVGQLFETYLRRLLIKSNARSGNASQTIDDIGDAKMISTCSLIHPTKSFFGRSEKIILDNIPETNRLITISLQNTSDPAFEI